MNHIAKSRLQSLAVFFAALWLAACGGGDGSPPPTPNQTSGFAVDGYLAGASVLCDSNGDGLVTDGETSVNTSSAGFFSFPEGCSAGLVISGGTNIDTGLRFDGMLKGAAGSTVVTPLTTLLVHGLSQLQLNNTLGLPAGTDVANTDPAATDGAGTLLNETLLKKTLAVQQLVQKTSEMLNGLTASADKAALPAIYNEVAAAFAEFLKGGAKLNLSDTVLDGAVVVELVNAAATRVAVAPSLSDPVHAAAKSVNSRALAEVTAGGLKVQAEEILKASGAAAVTAETLQQQSDTQITAYVVANQANLAGTPSSESVSAMSAALTQQVTASQGGGSGGTADSGSTGTCAAPNCVDFAGASVGLGAFGDDGAGFAVIDNDPKDANNKVAKMVKKVGDQPFFGAIVYTDKDAKTFTPDIVLSATKNTMTLRVYSPAAGVPILLKVEQGVGGAANQEVQVNTTKANAWETLSFTFSNPGTYKQVDIIPDFGNTTTVDKTFYFDELTLPAAGSGGGNTGSGSTGTCTAPNCVDFAGASVGFLAFGDNGGGFVAIDVDPKDANNKVARFVKKLNDLNYFGAVVYTNKDAKTFTPDIVLSATNNTMTLRVYSSTAGQPILLKVEKGVGVANQEVKVFTTKVNAWETLSFTFPDPGTYKQVDILPDFGNTTGADKTFYFDELTLPTPASGGGATTLTFSSGFAGSLRTVENGAYGGFAGSNFDSYFCPGTDPASCGGGGGFAPGVSAAESYFFFYVQTSAPALGLYDGVYVLAPGVSALVNPTDTPGVQITSQTLIKFNFGQNPEWFASNTKNFMVNLDLGKRYLVGGNACYLQLRKVLAPTAAAATSYTVALSSFTVVQNCGTGPTTVAAALAASPISQVSFQAAGGASAVQQGGLTTGANLSVPTGSPAVYPTTVLVKGAITFQ